MRPRISIVNSSSFGKLFPEHLERLKKFADVRRLTLPNNISPANLITELGGSHALITSVSPNYTAEVLRALPQLVAITRHGISVESIDIKAATQCGIVVSRVPGIVEREAVAEHTLALMLSVSRQITQARDAVHKGQWSARAQFIGMELKNKRVGLLGFGNVGRRTAEILQRGFNAEVIAFDPFLSDADFSNAGVKRVSFEELITTSSVLSLHCSLNDSNLHCLGEREFSLMKKGAILVNTSSGELINEQALLEALANGYLGAYATDVVEGSSINSEHPLLKHPNVLVVPHLGSYTVESLRGMGETVVCDLEQIFLNNCLPENIVDRDYKGTSPKVWKA